MKAITASKYGSPDVLKLSDLPDPVPAENEILVRIYAAGITTGDSRVRSLNVPFGFHFITRLMFGFTKPRRPVLGMDFAGQVESVGEKITQFSEGDRVFGANDSFGAYATHLTIAGDKAISLMPASMSYNEAAAIPFGATTSLYYLRNLGKIKSGDNILINGASGSLGTYAVQLGKYFGANVTGVCSTKNIELVKSLGADQVIDYTKEDLTKRDDTYDIIFDTVGKLTFSQSKNRLKEHGRFLMAVAGVPQYARVLWTTIAGRKKAIAGVAIVKKEDLEFIGTLVEDKLIKPVIGREYKMSETAQAHYYVDTGHKRGNVIITMN